MRRSAFLALCFLSLITSLGRAYSVARPERQEVRAPNGQFVLDVNPQTEIHTVYATKYRNSPLWSFTSPIWLGPIFLSDDGKVVAILAWEHVRAEDLDRKPCTRFWNEAGPLRSYSFAEICPNPRSRPFWEIGPIGPDWRVWCGDVRQDGDNLLVPTTDLYEYTFSLKDGAITNRAIIWTNVLRKAMIPAAILALAAFTFWIVRRRRARHRLSSG
jgi:hypothetical protein